jgi:hypothetical protein
VEIPPKYGRYFATHESWVYDNITQKRVKTENSIELLKCEQTPDKWGNTENNHLGNLKNYMCPGEGKRKING